MRPTGKISPTPVTPDRLRASLREEIIAVGVSPTQPQLDLFIRYLDLISRWRSRARLTAITDPRSAARLHIADSLLCLRAEIPAQASLLDVGSGAGLPGIPLAVVRPDLRVTLLEAESRKAAFLEMAAAELGLRVSVVCAAAEVAARGPLRALFDVATARAVAPLPALCELTLPFVRVAGRTALLKGLSVRAELRDGRAAALACGGSEPELSEWTLKGGERRVLVVIRKRGPTPEEFPRRPGLPRRRPIKG